MNHTLEKLESRVLFSSATRTDQLFFRTEERAINTDISTGNTGALQVREALMTDLNRLHLLKINLADAATLAKDEATTLHLLRTDSATLARVTNRDGANLVLVAADLAQHPTNAGVQLGFSNTLTQFQNDETTFQGNLTTDASATTAEVTDLNTIAALDPASNLLASDADFGVSNLSDTATTLGTDVAFLATGVTNLIKDSSNILIFGSENLFGAGYPSNGFPFAGATLKGLAANASSVATNKYAGPATFAPTTGDYPGTDQIYVGSDQVPPAGELAGPQVITLDYSSLVELGHSINSFTLGIATDGFENPTINVPYTVSINGVADPALAAVLNGVSGAGRVEQFVSIGIDPAQLEANKVLTISIDGPGDGVSGWAVDFLTVGIKNN